MYEESKSAKQRVVNELHKPARRRFPRRKTIVKGIDDLWQCDLAEMQQYAKTNRGYKFILVVIDCFSKYLWTRPVKSKSGSDVAAAMGDILRSKTPNHDTPKHIHTDLGKEFYNKQYKALMEKHSINHYSTYDVTKASMAERVIRTIKEKLYRLFSLRGSYKWEDALQDVTSDYNNSVHRTTGLKPVQVNRRNERAVFLSRYNFDRIDKRHPPRFRPGDVVRISRFKHVFEKGYVPNWTTELFKIVEVRRGNPHVYVLEDSGGSPIKGTFYEQQLQKTSQPDVYLIEKVLRKKGKKLYVKWLGFDNSHNSWIDSSEVMTS